jgi:hypothetical protein
MFMFQMDLCRERLIFYIALPKANPNLKYYKIPNKSKIPISKPI